METLKGHSAAIQGDSSRSEACQRWIGHIDEATSRLLARGSGRGRNV